MYGDAAATKQNEASQKKRLLLLDGKFQCLFSTSALFCMTDVQLLI